MWANNETGVIFPVEALAEEAKAVGAIFHTDAVQAAGRAPINLKRSAIDLLSLSAHKLHGPKGVGALYVRRDLKFAPMILGGRQERARRGGTENVPGIVGFGKAAEIAVPRLRGDAARMRALRDRLESDLIGRIRDVAVMGRGRSVCQTPAQSPAPARRLRPSRRCWRARVSRFRPAPPARADRMRPRMC